MDGPSAAIVTVGTELTQGLRVDTNTRELAEALVEAGYEVAEAVTVGDDEDRLSYSIRRLTELHALVLVTGGLGPTHDDVTRVAASRALDLALTRDPEIEKLLEHVSARHRDATARSQIFAQADVLEGAEVIQPTTGTAPGQIVPTPGGLLALLPGPPREMRGMLDRVLARALAEHGGIRRALPRELGVVGMAESDAQVVAQRVIASADGVGLTVLARLGDVRIVLFDLGAGAAMLDRLGSEIARDLGDACYSDDGSSLAATVVREAVGRRLTLSVAESCTGGMVASAITDVPGSSQTLLGGVVTYGDQAKTDLLGVSAASIASYGAVSREVVALMGEGAGRVFGSDIAVAISGIAGPTGGSQEKPVGTVWFHAQGPSGVWSVLRHYPGDREAVRARATVFALDLLRSQILGMSAPR